MEHFGLSAWSRHAGRMETANPATSGFFQLRSRDAALLHDHRSGAVARHARPHLATGAAAILRNQRRELEERPGRTAKPSKLMLRGEGINRVLPFL